MRIWMFVRELETLETVGIEALLDRLESGGVKALVLGDLWFNDGTPAYEPNLTHYQGLTRRPAPLTGRGAERAEMVAGAIRRARERGFEVYLHDWGHTTGGEGMNDPQSSAYAAARTRDTLEHFPEINGFITDGPEWGYEVEPGNRQYAFRPLTRHDRERAKEWGYDYHALETGAGRFRTFLGSLSPERVELLRATRAGLFDAADLFSADPEMAAWLAFRQHSVRAWIEVLYRTVKEVSEEVQVACGPRTSAFAPLAGYNLRHLTEVTDFLCPKLYFWAQGHDGLKGTLHRWACTLMEWNEGLSETQALGVLYRLFGFTLPGVNRLADLEQPFNHDFFRTVVASEINKAIFRAGSAERLQPWVGLHHGGTRLSPEELEWLLEAVAGSPLPGLIYWHYEDLRPEEWSLLQQTGG
jgi:hypothetical protein